jgi:hypothetical protein
MCRTRVVRLTRIGCAAIAGLLLLRGTPSAQDVTESSLKAAFIYNFAKFTEWPADAAPDNAPLVLCVLGDAAVRDALGRTVQARMIAGHSMTVSSLTPAGSQMKCHVLYVSGVTAAQAAHAIAGLRDAPVLTISDMEGFTGMGGIARFFFEHGRLRFTVHIPSADRAHLRISSNLLALATPE